MRKFAVALLALMWCLGWSPTIGAVPNWQKAVSAPAMPQPDRSGVASINGVRLWYGTYGHGPAVLLLHGALVNSNYWALQIRALAGRYRVIVLDSRGHGRSTRGNVPFSYDLMAKDAIALLDFLHVSKAAIVGWSDGADVGLRIAIHNPGRLTKLFAFAGNSNAAALKDFAPTAASRVFLTDAMRLYRALSPTPAEFATMARADSHMASGPGLTARELQGIRVPVWIVLGDHDQFIKRDDADRMAALIPGAGELILPNVSHGAPLQNPDLFNAALLDFLNE